MAAGIGGVGAIGLLFVKLAESGVIKYGSARIAMWHDPWLDYSGDGYQLAQSLITIGSGGLLGVGLGRSRQKFLYLPEQYNDFIFSVVCEELGLIGACVIMLIFALLILRGFWIALHARDRFGALLVVGIMTHLALQTFLNIAVVSGFVPTTRYLPAVLQLWRHGAVLAAGGDGHGAQCVAADPRAQGGVNGRFLTT